MPARRHEVRAQPVVRGGQKPGRETRRARQPRRDRRQRLPVAQRLRPHEMEPEVEIAEHEPALPTPRTHRLERLPALAGSPPAALGVVQPGQAVQDGVEVGRDVEAEHLEIVTDVADHRELTRSEHVVQPRRELRTADAAGEQDDVPHTRARPSRVESTQGRASAAGTGKPQKVRRAVSTSCPSSGDRDIGEPARPLNASGAARPVERLEHLGDGKRERVGGSVRAATSATAPRARPASAAGRRAHAADRR